MIDLFYVSKARVSDRHDDKLAEILGTARQRNLTLGITGALIFTGTHFAQLLEGPPDAVNRLMVSILKDRRHEDVRIAQVSPIAERRFATWSMAEVPPTPSASRDIASLFGSGLEGEADHAVERLTRYMIQVAGSARLPLG